MSVVAAAPAPFMNTLNNFSTCIWLTLFFGGFILPQVTGIMLSSVHESQRAQANGMAAMAYNLLGCLPAPAFYGMISSVSGSRKTPMVCLLYSSVISIGLLTSGTYMKLARDKQEKKK